MEQLLTEYQISANDELKVFIKTFPRGRNMKANEITYPRVLMDKHLISNAAKRGVTNELFNEIRANSPFSDLQWCVFLDINIRTLQRYKGTGSHIFKPIHSERILELAEVVGMGNTVFDTPEHFRIWLTTPSLALGGDKPIDLLDNSHGKDLVIAELNRIEHGIFV